MQSDRYVIRIPTLYENIFISSSRGTYWKYNDILSDPEACGLKFNFFSVRNDYFSVLKCSW